MLSTDILSRLTRIGRGVRDRVLGGRRTSPERLALAVGRNAADIQFALDRLAEEGLLQAVRQELGDLGRIRLISEGFADDAPPVVEGEGEGSHVLIIDPVDGTRGLMHDKRSAFCLLALAPDGPAPRLSDITHACMVEIPTSRSQLSDVLAASRDDGLRCHTEDLSTGEAHAFTPTPSVALDLRHGFGTIVRYCAGAGTAFGLFEDDFLRALFAGEPEAASEIYEDQFISNGGQMHALITGRDRFVADLRPLFVTREGLPLLSAHPYDVCAALIAEQAGVILTAPDGSPLDAPLDTQSRVAWVGYASPKLREVVEPPLRETLEQHDLLDFDLP